jgi:hypothetical protein
MIKETITDLVVLCTTCTICGFTIGYLVGLLNGYIQGKK